MQIGWYSEDEGLHLNPGFQLELVEKITDDDNKFGNESDSSITERAAPVSSPLVINSDRSVFGRSIDQASLGSGNGQGPTSTEVLDEKKFPVFTYESFISRTWALVVVAVAIFGACICLWMLIYVFIKMCDGTLNGNQTMGILLLFGIMCLFASVVPWLLPPNEMVCANRHFFHPLAMVLCFAILLVKAMQLRSLVSVGLGGTIPHVNQMVSLIFMLLVQVVIAIEWYISSSPLGIQVNDGYPECAVSKNRFLLLHLYPCTLLLLAFFYGISVLKIKRNFNEGRWITCAAVFVIPVFAAWSVVYYFAPIQYHDPSVAVSIVAVAGILLSAIFFPKMHTIAQQSKLKKDDLQRSHSDSTVFTAFSDYVQNFGSAAGGKEGMYPVYGNYHPHSHYMTSPAQSPPAPPAFPPPPAPGSQPQYMTMHPQAAAKYHFNGLNYVQRPAKRTARQPLTTYAEWTREAVPPERNATIHHHTVTKKERRDSETSADPRSAGEDSNPRRRCKSVSRDQLADHHHHHHVHHVHHIHPDDDDEEEDAEDNYSTVIPQQRSLSSSRPQPRHSTSPSDGMILTPAGLAYPAAAAGIQTRIPGRPSFHRHHLHQQHHPHQQQLYSQYHFQQPDLYLSTAT